jgi:hypothetical protein
MAFAVGITVVATIVAYQGSGAIIANRPRSARCEITRLEFLASLHILRHIRSLNFAISPTDSHKNYTENRYT